MYPPPGARILVAMSGGVDSAAVAILLEEAGYDCIGVTLRLVPDHPGVSLFEPCCGLEAAEDARRVCERIGIPHRVMHAVDRFDREVISDFIAEYGRGRTPNPCIRCNRLIKFGALYEEADRLGADYVAMGHYTRLEERDGRLALRRAVYLPKDQSYVLGPLTQAQLARAVFPLGGLTKEESRAKARAVDYVSSAKAESQEICFVHDRDYAGFLERRGLKSSPGSIVDVHGTVLGRHRGLIHYTIGQRRGLGIGASGPYYVLEIDRARNRIVVGHHDEVFEEAFRTGPIHWGGLAPQDGPFTGMVQLHSRHRPAPATLEPDAEGGQVRLHTPQRSITPGQWAVFYEGEYVAASAIVESAGRG